MGRTLKNRKFEHCDTELLNRKSGSFLAKFIMKSGRTIEAIIQFAGIFFTGTTTKKEKKISGYLNENEGDGRGGYFVEPRRTSKKKKR